jgi:sphingomyelin phosphodiesterase acid-like 3
MSSSTSSFVWMSDVHYDPYFGTSKAFGGDPCTQPTAATTITTTMVPRYGCDAPWSLIQSGILAASSHASSFVLMTGDYSRHGLDQVADTNRSTAKRGAVAEILRNVTLELQAHLAPGTIILPVLGNNDVLPDYYLDVVDRKSAQLESFADTLLHLKVLTQEEAALFRYGGYYGKTIGQIRILCLNTVVYSVEHTPKLPDYNNDPYDQFTWMEQELQTHDNVYIVGHIPPTISSYAHDDMWEERYRILYEQIIQRHALNVRAQLFGHFHDNEFRMHSPNMCMFMGPSITPVYNNNPAYRVIHYATSNGQLQDMDTYVFNVSDASTTSWLKLDSFVQVYDLDDMTPSSIQKGIIDAILHKDPTVLNKFLFNYKYGLYSHAMQTCLANGIDSCSSDWYCTLTCNSNQTYTECRYGGGALPQESKILLAIAGIAVLAASLCFYIPCCRRRGYDYDAPDVPTVPGKSRRRVASEPVVADENEII